MVRLAGFPRTAIISIVNGSPTDPGRGGARSVRGGSPPGDPSARPLYLNGEPDPPGMKTRTWKMSRGSGSCSFRRTRTRPW
ncbi:hypothetical protein CEXT_65001 [Caerostris extrusa]|uniref:Uncharacterized protein n=1 Tax=Caerostris extrusa TaxID=172846 RepID=A0AAV4N8E4_CAEEX|nr:hypothetical protein CEXT_65001 [Caerostris extrusa]